MIIKSPLFEKMRDSLVIGYDDTDEDDVYLMVARQTDDGIEIVNKFTDDCAKDLYKILVEK